MIVLGLTGSIGMGKSTAAAALRRLGVPVHDADAEVARLYEKGGAAVPLIEAAFPGTTRGGAVDRDRLRSLAFADPAVLPRLEAIVHPLVRRAERRFLARAQAQRRPVVVLDVPLLFESGGHRRCDATLVVTAPRRVQLVRVLRRSGMTPERLAAFESRQMPDRQKRRLADFVLNTGGPKRDSLQALRRIVKTLQARSRQCGCAKSFSTRKPRAWRRTTATGSSRSPASSS